MSTTGRRSALGLMVLGFLVQEPMHAYRIQKLIKQTGKERVVNIQQRASVYQTIDRLARLGLLRVKETERAEGTPERTVYEITPAGRDTAKSWLREMLSAPDARFPEFAAAVSVVMMLEPADAREQLEHRIEAIATELADVDATISDAAGVPRLFLLEEEYRRAVLSAQLTWTREVVADLRSGQLGWDQKWLAEIAEKFELGS
jgi:DNA-binding PadR family transcriptional regulator